VPLLVAVLWLLVAGAAVPLLLRLAVGCALRRGRRCSEVKLG
jgi:hypothetical protein